MEKTRFGGTDIQVSRLVLGTWVIGGWAWGGAEEKDGIAAVLRALEMGTNFIDTAPVYGFGKSEELVGEALSQWGNRDAVVIATKCGLEWDDKERIRRNSSPKRISEEIDQSLKRLGLDRIDLYQIHWPDPDIPFEDSMNTLLKLRDQGKIRYIGLSNFSPEQVQEIMRTGPVHSLQPPYNMFEREAEAKILPFCIENGIGTLVYGGLCRGLLTGKFTGREQFRRGDLRRADPKFKPDRFKKYADAAAQIRKLADKYGKTCSQFALKWALQQPGVTCVIAGARNAVQAEENAGATGWTIADEDLKKVERILDKYINEPIGPGFMAPNK